MRNRTARLCRMSALQHRPRGRAGATNDAGLYIASGHDFPICIARAGPRGIIFDSAIVDAIEDYISVNNINVVIVDPFVSTHNVPENDNTAINAVVGAWKLLADRCRISVMLVHHTRKPLQGGTVHRQLPRRPAKR